VDDLKEKRDTESSKRKREIALFGELTVEEAMNPLEEPLRHNGP